MSLFSQETCARLAKTLTLMCVRNTEIEGIHAGHDPVTKTGDYSDVKVIDAAGREFSWAEAGRITDDEMKILMKSVVNRVYTVLMQGDDPDYFKLLKFSEKSALHWDDPEIHPDVDLEGIRASIGAERFRALFES